MLQPCIRDLRVVELEFCQTGQAFQVFQPRIRGLCAVKDEFCQTGQVFQVLQFCIRDATFESNGSHLTRLCVERDTAPQLFDRSNSVYQPPTSWVVGCS